MESKLANTSRGPVEYTWLGTGPVVLVSHGTSSDCFSTESYAPLLEAGFSVLTPSRPGYGRTPSSTGKTAQEAAQAFSALLDSLEIPACHLLAISGGGPTGVTLAANFPRQVRSLVLLAALTRTADRASEASYQSQKSFYGPFHSLNWGMLGLISRRDPRAMARQTMAIFSTHDTQDALRQLSEADIQAICHFYQGRSARQGALNDLGHTLSEDTLAAVRQPVLVVHSREDKSVPFRHAEWSLEHIPQAHLVEAGVTGHFYWVGPDHARINSSLVEFLQAVPEEQPV